MFAPPFVPIAGPLAPVGFTSATESTTLPELAPAPSALDVREPQLNVLEGHAVNVAGRLIQAQAGSGLGGRDVQLQALGARGWKEVAHTRTGAAGRFLLRYVPRSLLRELMRVHFSGDSADTASHRRLGALQVYRLAGASWYGGGGTMACGGTLTSSTLGVANKTLPCGTLVPLRYDGRSVRVPVVDRGPYVEGREYDLTEATKAQLGFGSTGEVWSSR